MGLFRHPRTRHLRAESHFQPAARDFGTMALALFGFVLRVNSLRPVEMIRRDGESWGILGNERGHSPSSSNRIQLSKNTPL